MVATTLHVRRATCLFAFAAFAAAQSPAHAAVPAFSPAVSRALVRGFGSLPAFMSPAAVNSKTPVLFVADENTEAVYLLDANHINARPLGKITAVDAVVLDGVAIDSSENAYVSVRHYPRGQAQVLKFAPGSTQRADLGLTPGILGGFDARGNFYIGFGGQINAYGPGSTRPFRTIASGLVSLGSSTVAADGTIFAPNTAHLVNGEGAPGDVVEFAPNGSVPIARRVAADDVNPFATALRP